MRIVPARQRAFTLIELVVVMAIIGLLVTIQLPRYFHSIDRGKEQVRQQDLSVMRDAIDKYVGDTGQYPDTLEELVSKRYLRAVPVDPVTGSVAWKTLASPDSTKSGVYDVAPPDATGGVPAGQTGGTAAP